MAGKGKQKADLQVEVKTQSQWDSLLSKDGLVVVDAYSGWCGPCTAIVSTFRKLKNEIGDELLRFATAMTETIDSLVAYKGHSKPTFLFYGGGELVNVVRGCRAPQLVRDIQRLLNMEHQVLDGKAERQVFYDAEVNAAPPEVTNDEENADQEEENDDEEIVEVKKEVSMVIIKPDAVKNGLTDDIVNKITSAGIEVIEQTERHLSRDEAIGLYQQHQEMDYFDELIDFMTSDPSIILLLCKQGDNVGYGVIDELRDLLGPRDVSIAKEEAPESLRALYGTDTVRNALHACDSGESAARELAFFFPDFNAPTVQEKRKKPQLQRTLALIRPGALHRKDSILERVQEAGFIIAMSKELQLSREQAEEFYNEQRGSEHFETLVDHMISGPCMALCLAREDAVAAWRNLLGPKDVNEAKNNDPESLRAVFADDNTNVNPLHGADCSEAAETEIQQVFPLQSTVAVIKPDAYNEPEQRDAIISKIKEAGFTIAAQKEINLSKDLASQFYKEHEGKEFFDDLTSYMSSGPTLFMVLSREDAVEGFRAVIGPTDPQVAKSHAPKSLRAQHATDSLHNAIHGSSTADKAQEVINTFFKEDDLQSATSPPSRKVSSKSISNQDTIDNDHGLGGITTDGEIEASDNKPAPGSDAGKEDEENMSNKPSEVEETPEQQGSEKCSDGTQEAEHNKDAGGTDDATESTGDEVPASADETVSGNTERDVVAAAVDSPVETEPESRAVIEEDKGNLQENGGPETAESDGGVDDTVQALEGSSEETGTATEGANAVADGQGKNDEGQTSDVTHDEGESRTDDAAEATPNDGDQKIPSAENVSEPTAEEPQCETVTENETSDLQADAAGQVAPISSVKEVLQNGTEDASVPREDEQSAADPNVKATNEDNSDVAADEVTVESGVQQEKIDSTDQHGQEDNIEKSTSNETESDKPNVPDSNPDSAAVESSAGNEVGTTDAGSLQPEGQEDPNSVTEVQPPDNKIETATPEEIIENNQVADENSKQTKDGGATDSSPQGEVNSSDVEPPSSEISKPEASTEDDPAPTENSPGDNTIDESVTNENEENTKEPEPETAENNSSPTEQVDGAETDIKPVEITDGAQPQKSTEQIADPNDAVQKEQEEQ